MTSPLVLADFGSFFVPGHLVETTGAPVETMVLAAGGVPVRIDPNGTTSVGAMYVQYFRPVGSERRPPLLFWHGGSMSGVAWESTPDGRPGWLDYFLRAGWACAVVDAVERGRSGWAPRDAHFAAPAMLRTLQDSFVQFRLGTRPRAATLEALREAAYPGCRFPLEAFPAFMHQVVPRWSDTDDLALAAYAGLLERLGPAVIVAHSQGAAYAFRAAERSPGKVAAIVAVEPAQGGTSDGAALADVPVLALYGDHLARDARWPHIRARTDGWFASARTAGANIDVLDLPSRGIVGNSHLLIMENNNAALAALAAEWLDRQRLPRSSAQWERSSNA